MADQRSSLSYPEGAPALGHTRAIAATGQLAVNRMHDSFTVKGSATVKSLASLPAGGPITLHFTGSPTFVHSTKLLMPGAVNKRFVRGDSAIFRSEGNGKWRCLSIAAANPGPILLFEGDSTSNPSNLGTWPTKLAALSAIVGTSPKYFLAVDGAHVDTADDSIIATLPVGSNVVVYSSFWYGLNDIITGSSAATVYGYLTARWAARRAAGYKVIAWTISPSVLMTAATKAQADALNALILGDTSLYDYLMRPDLYANQDAIYSLDGTHFTELGNTIIAKNFAATVLGMQFGVVDRSDGQLFKNLALNAFQQISQENGSTALTATGGYPIDNEVVSFSAGVGLTAQQITAPFPSRPDISFALGLTITSSKVVTANDFILTGKYIEGEKLRDKLNWGTSLGRPLTVARMMRANFSGRGYLCVENGAQNRNYVAPFDLLLGIDQYIKITIPPDVAGTWEQGAVAGLRLYWVFMSGSSFLTTKNTWGSSVKFADTDIFNFAGYPGNSVYLGPVAVLPGIEVPNALDLYKLRLASPDDLRECQRYYHKSQRYILGYGASGNTFGQWFDHPGGEMRAAPAISFSGLTYGNASGITTGINNTRGTVAYANVSATGVAEATFTMVANARM